MGTLSGAEQISQSCRQSINLQVVQTAPSGVPCATLRFIFRREHHRPWAGDAAILPHAPEVNDHQYGSHDRNSDAMPDVGTQQSIRVYYGAAQQAEAHVVVWRHPQHFAEWPFVT